MQPNILTDLTSVLYVILAASVTAFLSMSFVLVREYVADVR